MTWLLWLLGAACALLAGSGAALLALAWWNWQDARRASAEVGTYSAALARQREAARPDAFTPWDQNRNPLPIIRQHQPRRRANSPKGNRP